jgi:hypothetical protein
MKKFIVQLVSNRFGIVLATLNVSYFLSMNFFQKVFSHIHGESCFVFKKFFLFPMILIDNENLMVVLNLPALTFSYFPYLFLQDYSRKICAFSQIEIQLIFFILFVVLQWLFVAWIAKTLAAKFRPKEL